ncbi:hypothetical protein TCAL_15213 [Tigriopus californicus]|uniref:Uncharacterized protein n=1 Tax=Tigriopus californicus TaxID=6832 RepID=A0A553NC82_TIGCA|nr:hypothetical protein TCAL_15213 [Tigriopus californicus]
MDQGPGTTEVRLAKLMLVDGEASVTRFHLKDDGDGPPGLDGCFHRKSRNRYPSLPFTDVSQDEWILEQITNTNTHSSRLDGNGLTNSPRHIFVVDSTG